MTADTGETKVTTAEITDGTGTDLAAGTGTELAPVAIGTEPVLAGTDYPRTGTPESAGTGTGTVPGARWRRWVPFVAPALEGTSTQVKAPVPVRVPASEKDSRADAACTEAALRAAVRRTVEPTGTRTASRRRNAAGTGTEMPLPNWMSAASLWADRAVGSVPLVAPMLVSGWYTFHVGTEALHMPWLFALLLTLALEGTAWKLARLYEKRLVAGHSTIAERFGLIGVVAAISALIFWHATQKVPGHHLAAADWRPASVAAGMSALGVFVWGRQARWNRRHELAAAGRLDMQALRIGIWSWLVSPWESAWAFRHGMKYRIAVPAEAVRDWNLWKDAGKPKLWPPVLPSGTEPVLVPASLLAALAGTGTAADLADLGTGTGGTGGTGTGGADAGGTKTGTGEGGAPVPGTAGTGTGGDKLPVYGPAELAKIQGYRERHRERLITVKANLRCTRDENLRWNTIPADEMPLSAITTAGRFANKEYAREIKQVLLYDRRPTGVTA